MTSRNGNLLEIDGMTFREALAIVDNLKWYVGKYHPNDYERVMAAIRSRNLDVVVGILAGSPSGQVQTERIG